jgi:hypothetical protein
LSGERLNVGPLLSRLLGGGVVLVDGGLHFSYADDRACELLGVPDVRALGGEWHRLRNLLHVHELTNVRDEQSLQQRLDLVTAEGTRGLRIELHPLSPAGCVVLIRDVHEMTAADRLLILASETCASRPALSGLVHRAKGPLNNFQLTLALLATSLARSSGASTDPAFAKWQRYLDVLQTEYGRLTACINEIAEHAHVSDSEPIDLDLNELVSDVAAVLRHEATLRDAAIKAEVSRTSALVHGNPHELRLALIGFAVCVLDRTSEKGSVTLLVDSDDTRVHVRITGVRAAPPDDMARTLFELSAARTSPHAQAVAGRLLVELHNGQVATTTVAPDAWGFVISIPLATTAQSTR